MKAQGLLVNMILGMALVSACQSAETFSTIQTEPPQPTAIRTKTVKAKPSTATSTSITQFSAEGAAPATATDSPKAGGGGVQLSLSPQAMQGMNTIASEYPGVKEEVFYSGGFGGGSDQLCILSETSEPPMIGYDYDFFNPIIYMCLVGFPENIPVQIDLYAPDGSLVGTKQFVDQGPSNEETFAIREENDQIVVMRVYEEMPVEDTVKVWKDIKIRYIPFWNPVGLPQGMWRAIASSGDLTKEVTIPVSSERGHGNDISTLPSLTIDPLENQSCAEYTAGETVYIAGSNFQPNKQILLGVYYETGEEALNPDGYYGSLYVKIFGTLISVSGSGDFLFQFPIKADAPDGTFFVYPNIEDPKWIDAYSFFSSNCFKVNTGIGTPTPRARPPQADTSFCPGAPITRLKIGDRASISLVPPNANTVREKPGRKNTRLGLLQPGEKIEILAGPRCADGWIWWKVVSLETGLDGWTPEGDMEYYWIDPGD